MAPHEEAREDTLEKIRMGMLRAEVRHDTVLIGGIYAYFATMQQAGEWVATFPEAVWAHIEVRRDAAKR